MGAPSFKECIAADVPNVFLNRLEFADTHTVNGKKMAVLVDENELLERDKGKLGVQQTGLYKSRRLIYVARSDFGRAAYWGSSDTGPPAIQDRGLQRGGRDFFH